MLVIIFVLLIGVFALIFTARMAADKYRVKAQEYRELDSVETGQLVTSLYELKCEKEGSEATCVDQHKALAMAATQAAHHDYYYELFKNARITLVKVYPDPEERLVLYAVNASDDKFGQSTDQLIIPVSLYNATSRSVSFGMLVIERFRGVS